MSSFFRQNFIPFLPFGTLRRSGFILTLLGGALATDFYVWPWLQGRVMEEKAAYLLLLVLSVLCTVRKRIRDVDPYLQPVDVAGKFLALCLPVLNLPLLFGLFFARSHGPVRVRRLPAPVRHIPAVNFQASRKIRW